MTGLLTLSRVHTDEWVGTRAPWIRKNVKGARLGLFHGTVCSCLFMSGVTGKR
jgi:hypothetical protein